ncbi:uncharacterized protein TNCV_692241 [Trichonephila clavipes]|nr:uncharacterized protein TNCV_692241 [Trichonephila clavipes]
MNSIAALLPKIAFPPDTVAVNTIDQFDLLAGRSPSPKLNSIAARLPKMSFSPCVAIVRVQYFVRGGFVGHRSRASSKHLSSHLPVDGVRFFGGQKGVALQLQDARVGVGSNKDSDHSRCSEK